MLSSAAELLDTEVSTFTSSPAKLLELLSEQRDGRLGIFSVLQKLPFNDTIKQVLRLQFQDQKNYLEELYAFNREASMRLSEADQIRAPIYNQTGSGIVRKFNQLPCDIQTRKRRADLFESRGMQNSKILLLGDDDLLSYELVRRKFQNVMVADCDRILLEKIAALTTPSRNPPRLFEADFSKGFRSPIAANVICLDPAHHMSCVQVFINRAVENMDKSKTATLFLMINPYVLGKTNTLEIIASLRKEGFFLANHFPRFNAYPLDAIQKWIVRTSWRVVLGKKLDFPTSANHFFFSDCFEFVFKPQ